MRKIFFILILLHLISCENEVRVNMDNSGLPVAYCILNLDDSVQYVRLAKSFFPDKGYLQLDHLTLDQWDEPVEIYLEEWLNPQQPVIRDFYRSDTIRQDTGYFSKPSFHLYQSDFKPVPNTLYYLYLWFPNRNYYAYGSTRTVDHPEIITPAQIPGRKITFSDTDDFIVQLRPSQNSEYHQFSFILTIEEHIGNRLNLDYFTFGGQVYEQNTGQLVVYLLNSKRFYEELLNRYDPLSSPDYRRITGVEFAAFSYGAELRLYNQLYNNGAQPWEIQTYSSFQNGFGLFSSTAHSRTTNLELSNLTYQVLTQDSRYTDLKFIR